MANEEHLAILKQGVEAWNKWREENPTIVPNLIGRDLSRADLHQANLRAADLHRANLRAADLCGADLREANLYRAILTGADLNEANLRGANLHGADLNGTNLHRANLRAADLVRADLHKANLSLADLHSAKLSLADLSVAYLLEAKLSLADLHGADLRGANLRGADLRGADLNGANVTNAEVNGTSFDDIDLSVAKGFETVQHFGPSTIGIDTIYKSKGKIPEAFLQGCGVPDSFIAYIGTLVGRPIEYYSCFISYSSKNQDFAERLHNDLQAKGVRCWFAPEDLKIGDKFRTRIDEAILYHDKLLLILSEHSINSDWVEKEIEAAIEKERQQERTVLFPVRLDDTIWGIDQTWAADIRQTRHIGDFATWKDHDAYQKAFDRLLRDLKAESTKASA